MSPSNFTYDQSAVKPSHVVKEEQIEYGFIGKLQGLKYEYRADIRDRASLERNFKDTCKNTFVFADQAPPGPRHLRAECV